LHTPHRTATSDAHGTHDHMENDDNDDDDDDDDVTNDSKTRSTLA